LKVVGFAVSVAARKLDFISEENLVFFSVQFYAGTGCEIITLLVIQSWKTSELKSDWRRIHRPALYVLTLQNTTDGTTTTTATTCATTWNNYNDYTSTSVLMRLDSAKHNRQNMKTTTTTTTTPLCNNIE